MPTRVAFGPEPLATAWFADRKPEQFTVDRLAEYVTEQGNPGNMHHVTRIVVELPARRLREGIVYVDTRGLGGLATAGAAETRAYLPKCDLGVVLIDAGATLTLDDLGTIQALSNAGITAAVLLSKADLLEPADRERAGKYVAEHIRSDLGLDLAVYAVSIRPGFTGLLESWLEREILPLYDRHSELSRQSLNRKVETLRLAVEAALKAQMRHACSRPARDTKKLKELESELRAAAGKTAETRAECIDATDELRNAADGFMRAAAIAIAAKHGESSIRTSIEQTVAERAARISSAIDHATKSGLKALRDAVRGLGLASEPDPRELADVANGMPRFDLGGLELPTRRPSLARFLGERFAAWSLERQVQAECGEQIREAVRIYGRVLQSWVRKTFADLQGLFDSYADGYRAQLSRLVDDGPGGLKEEALRDDLSALASSPENALERNAS